MGTEMSTGATGSPALVAEAARRSRVCWLRPLTGPGAERPRLVWHVWYADALVVLADRDSALAGTVEVVMRSKDARSRLVTWHGVAQTVLPGDQRWEGHAGALLGVRLNLVDPEAARARWRDPTSGSAIVRITPPRRPLT
jgi:hypothetical protein